MPDIQLILPDKSSLPFPLMSTGFDLIAGLDNSIKKSVLAMRVGNALLDLSRSLEEPGIVQLVTSDDTKDGLEIIRHSTAHLMAMAITELFPRY